MKDCIAVLCSFHLSLHSPYLRIQKHTVLCKYSHYSVASMTSKSNDSYGGIGPGVRRGSEVVLLAPAIGISKHVVVCHTRLQTVGESHLWSEGCPKKCKVSTHTWSYRQCWVSRDPESRNRWQDSHTCHRLCMWCLKPLYKRYRYSQRESCCIGELTILSQYLMVLFYMSRHKLF